MHGREQRAPAAPALAHLLHCCGPPSLPAPLTAPAPHGHPPTSPTQAGASKEARERMAQHQEFFEFNQERSLWGCQAVLLIGQAVLLMCQAVLVDLSSDCC